MFILCQTATDGIEYSAFDGIIADVYFVSNRNIITISTFSPLL